ncbi:radical SAM protein [Coprothermobacteraceae bacterium]|nr:radical SAM protein [Coprothermobacteraceae bacterium]
MKWEKEARRQRLKNHEKWFHRPLHYGEDVELIVFPGTYSVGVANLGFQFLLSELASRNRPFDRYFADPLLPEDRSFDTGRDIKDFRRWDITLSYEENLLELLKMLLRLGIPLNGAERDFPLLNIGGAMTYVNPQLTAYLANEYFAGEADGIWPEVRQRETWKVSDHFGVHSSVISPEGVFGDTFLVEVARGCVWQCKFCLYKAAYGKLRLVPLDHVFSAMALARERGVTKIGFVAANVSDVPWIHEVLEKAYVLGMKASVSSLAVETLDGDTMLLLRRLGVQQLTLGVEHGDEGTRLRLGKPYPDDRLVELAIKAQELGFRGLKLYFINGVTPDPEFNASSAVALLKKIVTRVHLDVKVSASVFVPKRGTPLFDAPFPEQDAIEAERNLLRKELTGVTFTFEPYYEAQKEFVMSRLIPEQLSAFVDLLAVSEKKAVRTFAELMR